MSSALTLVISDLHVGGGPTDPGDDHVYQGNQLVRWLEKMSAEKTERIELVINGDFLEFTQVAPEAYTLGSTRAWCSEIESLQKLGVIVGGHPEIFTALKEFQSRPSRTVTIMPGNHDVDLYWPRVQEQLRAVAGPVTFEIGKETIHRHKKRVVIGHGHQHDPANAFMNWAWPFVEMADGRRLEMCAGTLFMVKFINGLESEYPFADNVKPISQFARFILRQGVRRWAPVAWAILRFAARHPGRTLATREPLGKVPEHIRQAFKVDRKFRARFTEIYRDAVDPKATDKTIEKLLKSDGALEDVITTLAITLPPDRWTPAFDHVGPATLQVGRSGFMREKDVFRARAKDAFMGGARIVVFGHTHQPDVYKDAVSGGVYLNPGSWTRYVELDRLERNKLTLENLKNEAQFPYQLNWIHIEETPRGALGATRECFERQKARYSK